LVNAAEYEVSMKMTSIYPGLPAKHRGSVPYSQGRSLGYLLSLLLLAGGTLLVHRFAGPDPSKIVMLADSIIFLLAIAATVLRKLRAPVPRNWLSLEMIFVVFYFGFHYGYFLLYSLDLIEEVWRIMPFPQLVNPSLRVITLSGIGFLFGYGLAARRRVCQPLNPSELNPPWISFGKAVTWVGFGLQVVGILLAGFDLLVSLGYRLLTEIQYYTDPRLYGIGPLVMTIGICIAAGGAAVRGRMIPGWGYRIFFGLLILATLAIGDRGVFLAYVLPPILAYHYFIKPLKVKRAIAALAAGMVLFAVIGLARDRSSINPIAIFSYGVSEGGIRNTITAGLVEMGGSARTVAHTMNLVPNPYPYWMGKTIWGSIQMIIPNVLPSTMNRFIGPAGFITYESYGRDASGLGFSIAAEGYINFGIYGVFFVAAVGAIFRWIYQSVIIRPTMVRIIMLLMASTCLVGWIRGYSAQFVRPMAWTLSVVIVFELLVAQRVKTQRAVRRRS